MKTIGSQMRETLEESGYSVYRSGDKQGELILDPGDGWLEIWVENDHFAGHVIEINGKGYEFVRSVVEEVE